jgi:hypothetical protein
MIKTTVYKDDFVQAFCDFNRQDNFSVAGRIALYDYLESLSDDIGEDIELDVVALCCEYSEYPTALEAAQAYGYEEAVDLEPHGSLDLLEVAALEEEQANEWLLDRTSVIGFTGGIIIQQF